MDPIRVKRALSQRIYLIDCQPDLHKGVCEYFILGTSDQVYVVTIHANPDEEKCLQCTCPDFKTRKSICKHIIFVLLRARKLDAKLSLDDLVNKHWEAVLQGTVCSDGAVSKQTQRLADDGECSICLEELGKEPTSWCQIGCGNTFHKACVQRWLKSGKGTCVLCRSVWVPN